MRVLAILSISILLFFSSTSGQQKAVTDMGDEVILYSNGTWKYITEPKSGDISTNKSFFKKEKAASFLLKSNHINMGVWLDPKKWKFNKSKDSEASEYEFELKGESVFGMTIVESVDIPLLSLRAAALENAKSIAVDTRVSHEEYRMVNGLKVLSLEFLSTIQGIEFLYYGYYYSGENGTIQLLSYTYSSQATANRREMETFLNGLTIIGDGI
mgnify:CR=1 FL=1